MPNKGHYSSNWMDMMVIKLLSKSRCVNLVIIELRDYERKRMEISHLLATEICVLNIPYASVGLANYYRQLFNTSTTLVHKKLSGTTGYVFIMKEDVELSIY